MSDYDLSKSNKTLESKLKSQPRSHDSLFGLGLNFFYMNDFDTAAKRFLEALKLFPDDSTYHLWLGLANFFYGLQVG
jgi:tetratricopeptide (TPR) repeat protein